MNIEMGGPSQEAIQFKAPQLVEFGGSKISDADRQRAAIATAFMQNDRFTPQIRGVGIAPQEGASEGTAPTVFVVTYSSNPDFDLRRYTILAKKDNVAVNVARNVFHGGLKRFAKRADPEEPQFQSPLKVEYDQKNAKREWERDPNKPALVVVTDGSTKAMTTFAICWTQEEADKTFAVWQDEQRRSVGAEPRVANIALPKRAEPPTEEATEPQYPKKRVSTVAMNHFRATLSRVGKKRIGS